MVQRVPSKNNPEARLSSWLKFGVSGEPLLVVVGEHSDRVFSGKRIVEIEHRTGRVRKWKRRRV
jgi:hypothetical protein